MEHITTNIDHYYNETKRRRLIFIKVALQEWSTTHILHIALALALGAAYNHKFHYFIHY